ncbi:hypothetical protein H072_3699 [Dactylellina haptotyla CBS 200.50]|uniref:NAD(P)-binding protein n=1 Tax=Dactylellina haptotyla (strain CBS 200.50) TaxID=1284197 RepID=S8AHJ3_DACHA|nr:hypothetical protein H072_3699 [Dactylellina haptotyla CBS 200.50]
MTFTPKFDPKNTPDLTGKVAVVTGANVGIGLETAFFLASKNATVYMAARSEQRALAAIDQLQSRLKAIKVDTKIYYHHLDLGSIKGVRQSAEEFMAKEDKLDILVCNAGAMGSMWTPEFTYEPMFQTNHLGHFAFVTTLLPLIERTAAKTGDVRIVMTSSDALLVVKEIDYDAVSNRPANADAPRSIMTFKTFFDCYGRSKLANMWFAKELDRRIGDKGIWVNSPHPGFVGGTDLGLELNDVVPAFVRPIARAITRWTGMSWADGAKTQLYLVTSPEVPAHKIRGRYFSPRVSWFNYFKAPRDQKLAASYENEEEWKKLWDWSEEAVKKELAK